MMKTITMRNLMAVGVAALMAFVFYAGCGSSSTATPEGGDSGAGTASIDSLASVPSADLSTLDKSTTTSANLAAPVSKGLSVGKAWGDAMREVGRISRAGCEANMHKQEITRMSQQIQASRCYPEAAETVGLIVIPDGSYNYYEMTPPKSDAEYETKVCEGISEADTQRRDACLAGEGGGKGGKEMKMRIGKIGGELHIDMCESGALMDEATFGASGSVYSVAAIHSGNWAGAIETSRFDMTVDLGTDGYVTDGVVALGTSGSASATGHMIGGFGSGLMNFEAVGADSSNKIRGAFAGSFTDPFTQAASSFTGKVYSHFGGATATGCAKYSFGGTQPPMRIEDMVPFGISQNDLANFMQAFGAEIGVQLTIINYQNHLLCTNPDFNPEVVNNAQKPFKVIAAGGTCPQVVQTGIECFSIKNITRTGDFGTTVRQSFTIIANSGSPYYDEVNASEISGLDPTVSTPAFVRAWDCTGSFQTIDFGAMSQSQMATMQTEMQKCRAIEEKAMANDGMGGYSCGKDEQMNGMNDFVNEGAQFGAYGGEYGFAESSEGKVNTCARPGEGAPQEVSRIFVNMIDDQTYCIPNGTGACPSFTVANNIGTPDAVIPRGSWEIDHIDYFLSTSVEVGVTYSYNAGGSSCVQYYYLEKPSFNEPGAFGGEGGGTAPGEAGFVPDACKDASGVPVSASVCSEICADPSIDCRTSVPGGGEFF